MKKHLFQSVRLLGLGLTVFALLISSLLANGQEKASDSGTVTGTIVATTNAASYTYIQVDTGKDKVWAAAPGYSAKLGDKVSFSTEMPMKNFQSKALNRTFETLYFVQQVSAPGLAPLAGAAAATGQMDTKEIQAAPHAGAGKVSAPAGFNFAGIQKAKGGYTVAELYQQKDNLEKRQVTVRGKVVKYNAQVMKKNWVHLQDGTGAPGANDLTVTTEDTAKFGDTILVQGTLVLNKDFGYGYKYGLILEDAKVTVEPAK